MAQRSPAVKKRNPNDSTFRNITALKRKLSSLNSKVDTLDQVLARTMKRVTDLEKRLDAQPTGNESVFPLE